ncbi:Potassium channel domain [Trinorchestia longiramus]|nr:Potassium channel domain [Trinorchestia longiramus]
MTLERGRQSQRMPTSGGGSGPHRSSQRSHGRSSSSSRSSRHRLKDCCRKFISLMCTQVGVGSLLVSYAIVGAFAFIAIEGEMGKDTTNMTVGIHNETLDDLWRHTFKYNVLNKTLWSADIDRTLIVFQRRVVDSITKGGYEVMAPKDIWTFPAALMYCLSVFTMIGYGHMTPKTVPGKISTILYAVIGIPLYIVYFMNMGRVFAKTFKFLYRSFYKCLSRDRRKIDEEARLAGYEEPSILVPSTACIWVMILYVLFGTVMFAEWENWTYLNACYFSFTSLAKIGIGDIVPGIGLHGHTEDNATKLIINFMYLLIGMGLIAMCFTLMKEEFLTKINTAHEEFKEKMYFCGLRLGLIVEEQEEQEDPEDRFPTSRTSKSYRKSVRHR